MALEIIDIRKSFGDFSALHGVTLKCEPGEFIALLGPSGSGKTTLLRILAGLEAPDVGALLFDGENLLEQPARQRRVGMVFQHYALFRHMTVSDNIAFGLAVRKGKNRPKRGVIKARVAQLLELMQLSDLGKRYPSQLSGGQRQRVALARALAIEPRMLLLDEPFGALDAKVRKELRRWLRSIHDQTEVTTVFVTHDQEEALDLADRVVVLNAGRIEQIGKPEDVYAAPASAFVYAFLGNTNRFDGEVRAGKIYIDGYPCSFEGQGVSDGPAVAYARPHDVLLVGKGENGITAEITSIFSAGPLPRLELRRVQGGGFVEVELADTELAGALKRGDIVVIRPRRLRVFP
jgi:sulfate transport system ATP-binding protein